ncbi:MAG: 2-amino-4-hydroxy-6-hydroxymethyldihydropteridine diphosphokinase [Sphingomonadaceae bacterium]
MRRHLTQHYLIALGSNMRVPGVGSPRSVLFAARDALERSGLHVDAFAPIIESAAMGPSLRRYANGAAVIATDLMPLALMTQLHRIEAGFGRRRRGQRWRARPLDLDIILWSGGVWQKGGLTIPHRAFRERDFVLTPAVTIAPDWCDPGTGLSIRALNTRLTRPRPLPR